MAARQPRVGAAGWDLLPRRGGHHRGRVGMAGSLTAFMESYQVYFILAGLAVMGLWLVRHLRRRGISR